MTALVFKFVEILKSGSRQTVSPSVQTKDIVDAEHYWIMVTQRYLVPNDKFNEWKVQFGLYIDDSVLWRCGGRLNNSSLSERAKHLILLPTGHHFISLVALDCHKRVLHGGVRDTLTEIRMRFWILRGRSILRKVLRRCTVCTRFNARPFKAPEAPPLPQFHVQEYPPFSCV